MATAGQHDSTTSTRIVPHSLREQPDSHGHPDLPVLGPLTGTWSRTLSDDHWYWSDEMYVIHGFAPGAVVPSTDLMLCHKHPEDREPAVRLFRTATEFGTPFSNYHRIIDAHARTRYVLTVGRGLTAADGSLVEVTGYMVDLTETRRRDVKPAVDEAIKQMRQHSGAIEQAKGALMLAYAIDADAAFDVLRDISNSRNVKVSQLAQVVVDGLARLDPHLDTVTAVEALWERAEAGTHSPE